MISRKFALFLPILVLFTGCSAKESPETLQYVTAVEVSYRSQSGELHRRYTHCDKMDVILRYLYALEPWGQAEVDPEQIQGDFCRIRVFLSNGEQRLYRQIHNRYFSVDSHRWQKIKESEGSILFHLLSHIESDT